MSEPTEQDIMSFLANGWGGMDNQEEQAEDARLAQAEENYELNKAIQKCFSTPNGKIVLNWLRGVTIEQSAFNPQHGIVGILQGFSREGQNSIYREIVRRMDVAKDGPPSKK